MEGGRAVWPWHRAQLVAGAPSKPQATVTPRSLSPAIPLPLSLFARIQLQLLAMGAGIQNLCEKLNTKTEVEAEKKNKQKINSLFFMPLPPHSPLLATPSLLLLLLFVCLLQRCLSWRFVFQLRFVFFLVNFNLVLPRGIVWGK